MAGTVRRATYALPPRTNDYGISLGDLCEEGARGWHTRFVTVCDKERSFIGSGERECSPPLATKDSRSKQRVARVGRIDHVLARANASYSPAFRARPMMPRDGAGKLRVSSKQRDTIQLRHHMMIAVLD